MKVEVKDIPNSQKEVSIEIEYQVYKDAEDNELDAILPSVNVPGFRKGKAPKERVRKLKSHQIKSQAIEKVVNEAIQDAFSSNSIVPISQAHISDMVFEDNKPITFKARVDVFPVLNLDKYKDFNFNKVSVSVTDKDVEDALITLQERDMTYEPVEDRDEVKDGNIAVIDFVGKKDGVAFEGGTASGYSLNIGSGQFIPGFESGVVGMKKGETRDLNLKFPDEYDNKDLAGQDVVFTVTLHEIKEKVKPEIDDDFASSIDPNSKGLDDLKEKLKKGMQYEIDRATRLDAFGEILEQIVKENPFDVPYSFIKEQSDRLAFNGMNQFYQMGVNPEQMGITFEMMAERYLSQAEEQVKQALVINEVAKMENLVVENDDVDNHIAKISELQGRDKDEVKKELEKNMQIDVIRNDILGDKVYDFLATVNNKTESTMTKEEYEKARAVNNINKKAKENDESKIEDTKEEEIEKELDK